MWLQRLVFPIAAILIGLVIVIMTVLGELVTYTYSLVSLCYPWFNFVMPPVGMGLTSWITFRFFSGSERSGIPQIKIVLDMPGQLTPRSQLISLKIALAKICLPIMGLFSGASVGLGGPAIHVGASIMLSCIRVVKFPPPYLEKALILAGSAAGFAALFSTPLAGIMFAIEEMGRSLEEKISTVVLMAIIFSSMTAYALLNRYIYFEGESLALPLANSWLAVPLCGFTGGLLGSVFSKVTVLGNRLLNKTTIPIVAIAMVCGSIIAIVNYVSQGATVGTGYQQTKAILHSTHTMDFSYPFLKMIATWATFFSGIPSGMFVPSIAIGAGFGLNLAHWFPIAPISVMILLTTTAYLSGILQSPLTSFVVIMEMTNSHEIVIPLMATAFLASATSKLINPIPLYLALCEGYTARLRPLKKYRHE